jgi:nucleoside-diphosphate kinase
MQKTLSIIKPDAIAGKNIGKIISMIEEAGLKITAQKMFWLASDEAERFYAVHQDKSFFEDLIKNITSGPIIVQVLESENAVEDYRKLMGGANPAAAEEGTIRKRYGTSIEDNAVHGSDTVETANREIHFFFNELEIMK